MTVTVTTVAAINPATAALVNRPVSGHDMTRPPMTRKRASGPSAAGSPPDRM
jgi:hypothetical protein